MSDDSKRSRAADPPAAENAARSSGVTLRAVLIGLVLIPINAFWVTVIEVRYYALDGSCLPLFVTPIFMLFALVGANLLVRSRWPRAAFNQGELLTVYIMVVVSTTLAGHDTVQNLTGTLGHAAWHETPDNRWRETFFSYLPEWLLVWDTDMLRRFYEGGSTLYLLSNVIPWVVPLLAWSGFLLVLIGMMLCMNVLIRRAWTENEKLAYPIIQLPLAMTSPDAPRTFFRSRLMWIGFAFAFFVGALNGLHVFYPDVPYIPIKITNLQPYFRTRPWNAMGGFPISFYPFAIGLAYFVPLDLSFSCWFFYLFMKFQRIVGNLSGWDRMQDFPFINEQASGAWLGLAFVLLWSSRQHLKQVWRTAWGRGEPADPNEPIQYRTALLGLAGGMIAILVFWHAAGMSMIAILVFFALFFLLSLAITRVRAELGTPHEIYYVNPRQIMLSAVGTDGLGPRNLAVMSLLHWLNRGYRNHPMPNELEAFKMADSAGMHMRRVFWVLALATIVSLLAALWANLYVPFIDGAESKDLGFKNWVGSESFGWLQNWLEYGRQVQAIRLIYTGGGMLLVFALKFMRGQYTWWMFHPAGYALGVSYAMEYFWFAFFVSWLIKLFIVRFGGMRLHRAAIPFFLGLILGDYTIGSLLAIVGPLTNTVNYKIFI